MTENALFTQYCAKDTMTDTQNMDPLTELAYRRICDMIYSTNDNLLDNASLQYGTKTGAKWKKIRQELIEVHQAIYIEDGFIRNEKCKKNLQKTYKNIEQKRLAGKASSEKRKQLKNNDTGLTAVGADVEAAVPTGAPTNYKNYKNYKEKNNKKENSGLEENEAPPTDEHITRLFDEFWEAYPRKVAAAKARIEFEAALAIEDYDMTPIMEGLARYIAGKPDWSEWCYPATWLSGGRWRDEWDADSAAAAPVEQFPDHLFEDEAEASA